MSEEVIKTSSCCPEAMMGGMMGSMFNRHDDGLATAAMMNGGMNNWMNNPFVYLVWMMFANRMWGNDGNKVQDAEIQAKLNALSNQMSDNHNSDLLMSAIQGNNQDLKTLGASLNCDFNQLQSSVCAVRSAIEQVGGQVGYTGERVINSVINGNLQLTQALKDCCCQTQQNIIKMGYENQIGQKEIENSMQRGFDFNNRSVERGFSALGYQMATDKCDIIRANQDSTQRIVDVLQQHWQADLQQRYNDARLELSQQRQNAALIAALKTTTTTTATT